MPWCEVNSCPLWLTDYDKNSLPMYPVSEPRCQAETSRIQSWSDSCLVARRGAKLLKMRLTSSHSDFIWHLTRLKFTDSDLVTYETSAINQIPLSNTFHSRYSSERERESTIFIYQKKHKNMLFYMYRACCIVCYPDQEMHYMYLLRLFYVP